MASAGAAGAWAFDARLWRLCHEKTPAFRWRDAAVSALQSGKKLPVTVPVTAPSNAAMQNGLRLGFAIAPCENGIVVNCRMKGLVSVLLKKLFGQKAAQTAKCATPPEFVIPETIKDALFCAQPPHIQTHLAVVNRIARDVLVGRDSLQRGTALAAMPIYCDSIARLFQRAAGAGAMSYLSYCYSPDLQSMDPNAQLHLSQFYGRIAALNTALTSASPDMEEVAVMLDKTLLDALFFTGFFSSYALSTDLLTRQITAEAAGAQFQALIDRSKADFAGASAYLYNPERAFGSLPMTTQPLLIEAAKPFEAGQTTRNGVYFDTEMAAQLQAHAALNQSKPVNDAKPALPHAVN